MHLPGVLIVRGPSWTVAALLGHLARATVAGLVILTVMFAARRASARTRWIIGWIGLIRFVLPLVWFTPALVRLDPSGLEHLNHFSSFTSAAWAGPAAAAAAQATEVPAQIIASAHARPFPWMQAGAGVWALGTVLLCLDWWLRGRHFRRRILAQAEPVSSGLRKTIERAGARAGLRAVPRCLTVADPTGPALLGVWSPVIVLPRALEDSLSAAEAEALLLHEFTHWRRRDTLLSGIQAVLVRLFWFDPVIWLLHRQLCIETEKSCDEEVLKTAKAEIYAGSILKMVRQSLGLQQPSCAGVTGVPIVARMKNILAHSTAHRRWAKFTAIAAAVALVAISGFAGSLSAETEAGSSAGQVLIFRDRPSWNRFSDFENVLAGLGQPFTVKPSSEMARVNFSPYRLIIVPGGQQQTGFYGDFAKATAKFDQFVRQGGTLLLELNGAEGNGIVLPGGAMMVPESSFVNVVVQPRHPAFAPLAGKLRLSGNPVSHGYLENVPAAAAILAVEMATNHPEPDLAKPTYVEYAVGGGWVIGACQGFYDQNNSQRSRLLPAVLGYALAGKWFAPDPTAYRQVSATTAFINASEEEGWAAVLRLDSQRETRIRGLETVVKPALAPGLRAVNTLINAGTTSPRAAIETLAWALHHGDLATVAKLIQFNSGGEGSAAALYARLPASARSQLPSAEAMIAATLAYAFPLDVGFRITGDSQPGDDSNERIVQCQTQLLGGPVQSMGFQLQKAGDGWKVLIGWKVVADIEPTLAKVARAHISVTAD